ncbi:hypothetical protein A2774_03760 [Candidatus Roizmanbacteria bacterium RIFCSPHIGHO2_01_FULL_39_12c]|uniref:tRNA N6-adenosine threonylcarbamoyltransferase n=1 Tax=Candidatus Roizmanbacteria bacterium RIFCSPHIGHO2_01_FULL_39_12c TaxID=1802031 RepID=A0A1F7GEK6_9BACT|nr:MAG: hypothetical protein A2774_03760 [Candidatus Roizmanbacteria bacterium RIFCSPHIGHO2_01_FULL_39_12c]OGK47976.1 MAG: hypothetical protein A2963_00090 [Candidatus Roizmanbacteria bacterium RIFCSPLOWO2_01_FULL_40_13]
MLILAIETSADETAAAITEGRKVLSNVIYSQINLHKKWGGIYPSLAKRAHEERIDKVIEKTLINSQFSTSPSISSGSRAESRDNFQSNHKSQIANSQKKFENKMKNIDYIAVTQGPGLAVALEVGIKKAKELAAKYQKKLIAVNHLEGHIYSSFAQNSKGNPKRSFEFPYLALIVSGGHTEIVIFQDQIKYQVIGETRDDAAGEALDKAAKLLGLGYPGGPAIERLAKEVDNRDIYEFPRPMMKADNLDFSFSGLKTAFYYFLKNNKPPPISFSFPGGDKGAVKNIRELASSFQQAVFDTLIFKTKKAIQQTGINRLVVGGGVIANLYLRKSLRNMMRINKGQIYFPPFKYLTGDNAAMIGVAAYYKARRRIFSNPQTLDRIPRFSLSEVKGLGYN